MDDYGDGGDGIRGVLCVLAVALVIIAIPVTIAVVLWLLGVRLRYA